MDELEAAIRAKLEVGLRAKYDEVRCLGCGWTPMLFIEGTDSMWCALCGERRQAPEWYRLPAGHDS